MLAAIYQPTDLPRASEMLDESLATAKQTGNNLALSIVLVNSGRLMLSQGDFARAKALCQESLRLRGELVDKWGIVQCLEPLAAIAVIERAPRRAAKMLGAIDVLLESLGASPPLIFPPTTSRASPPPAPRSTRKHSPSHLPKVESCQQTRLSILL